MDEVYENPSPDPGPVEYWCYRCGACGEEDCDFRTEEDALTALVGHKELRHGEGGITHEG